VPDQQPPLGERPAGDDLGRLERELLRDREDAEALALWSWQRQQSLQDVLRACLARGDQLAITVLGGRSFRGDLVHTGGDLACVATTTALVNVNLGLPVVLQILQRATRGGRARVKQAQSFRRRLEEYEGEHQERPVAPARARAEDLLEFGSPLLARQLRGHLKAVCPDVVYVVDREGGEWYLPFAALTYVAQPNQRGD
jgi:hypothetical protein